MSSIIVIISYFGKMNDYFNLFLKSLEYNSTIDFLIITDDKRKFNYPKNCKVIYSTFQKESKRITSYFDFPAKCSTPYKICDYKPFLGEIYKEYTQNYDFWGWSEIDVIFGNIRKFITEEKLKKYDRFYSNGTFGLIRNDGRVNDILLNSPVYDDVWHCKEALTKDNAIFFYDEYNGSIPTLQRAEIPIYSNEDIANIDFLTYPFYLCRYIFKEEDRKNKMIFHFQKGNLFSIEETGSIKEWSYVHFQKRYLKNSVTTESDFLVIPNQFINYKKNFDLEKEFKRQEEEKELNYDKRIIYNNLKKKGYYQCKKEALKILEKEESLQ